MSQFRPIGKIAAQLVQQQMRVDLAVGDATATVLVAEGCGQLIWHRGAEGQSRARRSSTIFWRPGWATSCARWPGWSMPPRR
ncbi:hypothetical protein ACFSHQ_18105 [Gemmobacter lanyuensis]